jgi:hypothetical protein
MVATCEVEVYVLVDGDGNYVASEDADALADRYDEVAGNDAATARRRVKVVLTVPLPVEAVLRGTVPELECGELASAE